MRFSVLGSLAFAAGSASASGLFDFESHKIASHSVMRRANGDVQYDSCGVPLKASWTRHGTYSKKHGSAHKRTCEERRAAYHDQGALGPYESKPSHSEAAQLQQHHQEQPQATQAWDQKNTHQEDQWSGEEQHTPEGQDVWSHEAVSQEEQTWEEPEPSTEQEEWQPESTEEWQPEPEPTSAEESWTEPSAEAQAQGAHSEEEQDDGAVAQLGQAAQSVVSEATGQNDNSDWQPPHSDATDDGVLARGLAWAVDDRWAPTIASGNIGWTYHWQDGPIHTMPEHVEFYPMLWGDGQAIDQFYACMAEMDYTPTHMLGPNEPDIPGQANLTPARAVQLWRTHLEPYADQGVQLCTPAPAHDVQWLQDFMEQCEGCRISCVAMHSYDDYDPNFTDLQNRVESFHEAFPDYDIWVTEYGLTAASGPTEDNVMQYVAATTEYFDSVDYIKRYAFFGAWAQNPDGFATDHSAFFNWDGSLSPLGNMYAHA